MGRDERFRAMAARRQQAQSAGALERMAAQARLVDGAMPVLKDRFGVDIKAGDLVIYRPPFDLVFKVEGVQAIRDPRVPPGAVTVTLSCVTPVHTQGGQMLPNFVVVGVAEETPPADPPGAPASDPPAPSAESSGIQLTDAG